MAYEIKPHPEAYKRFQMFLDDILKSNGGEIDSIHLSGSILTPDFDLKHSDINSVVVLKKIDLKFLSILAPLGKKYGKKRIAAPLIMTPDYIRRSLDVFPIEFLNIRQLHFTVQGEDIFKDINIAPADLRQQCERELKGKLIGLRQGYISAAGNRKLLNQGYISAFSGYIPLFRGIIVLFGKEAPAPAADVLDALQEASGVPMDPFRTVLKEKSERSGLSMDALNTLFEDCYAAITKLGDLTDALQV